jgi:REP-associated tyrosine transposase
MPRRPRAGCAGIVHHVLNRASRRTTLFATDEDYRMMERLLLQARLRFGMRLLDFVIMPNHWHLILWPDRDLQLSRFMHWMTTTHTQRWHAAHGSTGTGPLYQGRYKAIPIQADDHFLTVARYVQRNPVRAGLVNRVADWRWTSAWHRCNNCHTAPLDPWPMKCPDDWPTVINEPMNQVDLSNVRNAVALNWPYGDSDWTEQMARLFALKRTFRAQGRPCKK